LVITVGVKSEDLIDPESTGSVFTTFDKILVLFRSLKTVSVVTYCPRTLGMLVNNCAVSVLLAVNPVGNEVVFITEPLDECIFITAFIF
jgi:hypothetical protein